MFTEAKPRLVNIAVFGLAQILTIIYGVFQDNFADLRI